jgi:hypothetical protein
LRAKIHEGVLAVRQAIALKPIFEADTEGVDFPEGNSFHPESIIENALGGTPSGTLRKQVTQFESWLRQLKGKTQEEIRKQEYEQELESDSKADERSSDRDAAEGASETTPEHQSSAPETPPSSTDDRGSQGFERGAVRSDVDRAREADDDGQRDGPEGPAFEPVGGDGEASRPDPHTISTDSDQQVEQAEEIVTTVARQLADKVDAATPTWALMALGAGRSADRRTLIEQQIWSRMSQVKAKGPRDVAEAIRDWIRPMQVTGIEIPQTSSSGDASHSHQH